MSRTTLILSAAIFALLLGCREEEPALFVINGHPLCRSTVEAEAKLKFELFQNVKPIKDAAKAEKARKSLADRILANKIPEMLLSEASEGIAVTREKIKAAEGSYFKTFHGKLKDEASFREWLKEKGIYAAFCDRIKLETQIEEYLTTNFKDQLTVSDETVAETIKSMQRGNELAASTNAVIYALATNVWKRAAAGEDFAALANRYSNTIETDTDGDIGENCDFSDFRMEDISIWNTINRLKAGDVTPPLSTSEGLTIYKCYDRSDDAGYEGGTRYHLARIVFFRALMYNDFSPAFVRRELEKEAREKVLASILTPAKRKATITFPNGEKDLPKGFVQNVSKTIGEAAK